MDELHPNIFNRTENSEVLFLNKKRTPRLLRKIGFQMPIALSQSGSIGSIEYNGPLVNIKGVNFNDVIKENTIPLSPKVENIRLSVSENEAYKPTEGTVDNLWNGIDVGVRFSYGEQGTWYASTIKPNQGTDKPTQASVAKNRMLSGREMLRTTMEQYGNKNTWEDQFNSVSDFMDAMNQFFIDAGAKYRFIGLQDVENATVKVRRKGNKITGITMSAMIKNGEYPINFDFTTICKKRQAFNDVIEKLTKNSKVGDDISLTAAELMDINEALRKEGVETACLGCFVEARRYNMQNYTEKVVNLWNKCVDEFAEANGITDVPDFNFAGGEEATEQDFQDAADTFLSYGKTKGNKQSPEARFRIIIAQSGGKYVKHLRASDLVTANGVAGIKAMSTTKNDFYGMLKSAYGTAAPKETVKFVPYNSEIANLPKTKSKMPMDKYLKEIGGIRMQSFSDFLVANTFDYMQMVADAAARGFTAHSYTKEIAFAKIFGKTGVKINMSVMFDVLTPAEWGEALGISDDAESLKSIAKTYAGMQFFRSDSDIPEELKDSAVKTNIKGVDGWLTYLVSDQDRADRGYEELYKKAYDLTGNEETAKEIAGDGRKWMQSINFREAKELQRTEGYADNVGIIAVGLSDENIRHMMADDNIPYIIPYHASGLPGVVKARTNLDNATDYTDTQNTRIFVKATAPDGTVYNTLDEFKSLKGDKTWQEFYKMVNEGGYMIESKGDDTLHGTGEFDVYGPLEEGNTPQKVAERYMEYCAENGLIPVFSQFADHDGYYKVLFDYSVTNLSNGNTATQQVVRNNYPGVDVDAGENDYSELQQIIDDEMAKQNEINERRDAVVERVANDFAARFSVNEKYSKLLDTWDGKTKGFSFELGTTSEVLQEIGVKKYPIRIHASKIISTIEKHQGMEKETFKQLPTLLENPTVVMLTKDKNKSSRIVLLGEIYDKHNKPITVVLELMPKSKKGNALGLALVVTAQGRKSTQSLINGSTILYVNPQKNKTNDWLNVNRLQLPLRSSQYGLIYKIAYVGDTIKAVNVEKRNNVDNNDIRYSITNVDSDGNQLSRGQREFFANSKVVDEKGNLMVLYHGADAAGFSLSDIEARLVKKYNGYKQDKENLNYAKEAIFALKKTEQSHMGRTNSNVEDRPVRYSLRGHSYGIQTIGKAFSEDFLNKRKIDLRGQRVSGPNDLASLFQIYRDYRFETFRLIYIRNNKIVSVEGVTSRLPGSSAIRRKNESFNDSISRIAKKIKRVNADGIYILHNHPSGHTELSLADQSVTAVFCDEIEKHSSAKFLGHVVIDHDKYSFIDRDGDISNDAINGQQTIDFLKNASVPNPLLGDYLGTADKVAAASAACQYEKGTALVLYLNSRLEVVELQQISEKIITNDKNFKSYLRNEMRDSGSTAVAISTTSKDIYNKYSKELIEERFAVDVLYDDGNLNFESYRKNYTVSLKSGLWAGIKTDAAYNVSDIRFQVAEGQTYLEENQEEFSGETSFDRRIAESRARRNDSKMEIISLAIDAIDTKLTHGKVLDPKSVKNQIRELITYAMQNSDTTKKYKEQMVQKSLQTARAIILA